MIKNRYSIYFLIAIFICHRTKLIFIHCLCSLFFFCFCFHNKKNQLNLIIPNTEIAQKTSPAFILDWSIASEGILGWQVKLNKQHINILFLLHKSCDLAQIRTFNPPELAGQVQNLSFLRL